MKWKILWRFLYVCFRVLVCACERGSAEHFMSSYRTAVTREKNKSWVKRDHVKPTNNFDSWTQHMSWCPNFEIDIFSLTSLSAPLPPWRPESSSSSITMQTLVAMKIGCCWQSLHNVVDWLASFAELDPTGLLSDRKGREIVLTVFNFIFNQWQDNKETTDEERVDKTEMRLGFVNCCSRLHVSCLFLLQNNLFCGRTRERSPSRRMPSPPKK